MAQRVRTLVKGRLYLREVDLAETHEVKDIVNAFRVRSYDEMTCRRCPQKDERFSREFCKPCPAYHGIVHLAERVKIGKNRFVAFPLGAKRAVERRLEVKLTIPEGNDLREYPMMKRKPKVTVKLYDGTPAPDGTTRINQQKAVDDWLKAGGIGVIRAGARSGKTVLATVISANLGMKTLVVTGSSTLLKQFWDTFCGDGKARICATNIRPKRVIIINKMEDFLKPHDVALINYKKFIRETADSRIETFIKGKYGLLIGDEIHNAAAQAYANFLLKLAIPYRLGLTATPKRKDGRYHIAEAVFGPVVVSLDKVGLKPLIKIHRTGRFAGRSQRAWHILSDMWAEDKDSNEQLCKLAWEAIDQGHKAVLIPLDRQAHIDTITEMLNEQALRKHRKNRNLPEVVAMIVDGRVKQGAMREAKFEAFDDPESPFLFLVSQRSIVKEGVDLKRPSVVLCRIPMSATFADGSPLFEQLSYRGSTPYHGKCQPECILMVDEIPFIEEMVNKLLKYEILRNDADLVGEKRGLYRIDESCRKFLQNSRKSDGTGTLNGVTLRR